MSPRRVASITALALLPLQAGPAQASGPPAAGALGLPGAAGRSAAATYTGTLTVKLLITIKTGIPADWPILCIQRSWVQDPDGLHYVESKRVKATRHGGSAACTVTVYYAWPLTSPADMITTSYTVTAFGDSAGIQRRQTDGNLAEVQVPADGGTIARTVNVTF